VTMQTWLPLLQPIALALIPLVLAAFGTWARGWLTHRGYRTDVLDALARGAAAGYADMVTRGARVTDPGALKAAMTVGVEYALNLVPDKMAAVGVTDTAAAHIVGAELGKLLVSDPTITVGAGSVAAATAGPGQAATAEAGPARLMEASVDMHRSAS
jgi:hypothetical protein